VTSNAVDEFDVFLCLSNGRKLNCEVVSFIIVNRIVRHNSRARGTDKLKLPLQGSICVDLRCDKSHAGEET
jgi:hypothetical protein